MYTYVLIIHIFVAILLILAVLMQSGKGSDLASSLGGGSGDVFGPGGGANIMNKITTVIAISFMVTSLSLATMSTKKQTNSITDRLQNQPAQTEQKKPATK